MKTGSIFGFGTAFTVIHLSLWPVLAQNGPVASSVGILQSANAIATAGSCGFQNLDPNSWPSGSIASIGSSNPVLAGLPLGGCGSCIQVTCTASQGCTSTSPATVTIVDTGTANALYVPASVFRTFGNPFVGNLNADLKQVDCAPPGNILLRISEFRGTLGGYIKLTPFQVAGLGGVTSVDLKSSSAPDSAFAPLVNTFGATFEGSNLPSLPLDVRLSNARGQQVTGRNVISASNPGVVDTGVQFNTAGSTSSPTPAATPAPTVAPVSTPAPTPSPESTPAPTTEPATTPTPTAAPVTTPVPTAAPVTTPVPIAAPVTAPVPTAAPVTTPVPTAAPVTTPVPIAAPVTAPVPTAAPVTTPVPTAAPVTIPASTPAAAPIPAVLPPTSPSITVAQGGTAPAPAPAGECQTIAQILETNPALSSWYQALQVNGQASQLNNPTLQLTMFAPNNAALAAPLTTVAGNQNINPDLELVLGSTFAGTRVILESLWILNHPALIVDSPPFYMYITQERAGSTSNLFATRPTIRTPIIGYHVVPGKFPLSSLAPGTSFATTDVIRVPGQPDTPLQLNITAPSTVQGIGSTARIVQPDLAACGGAFVHVVDNVLLPFDPTGPLP